MGWFTDLRDTIESGAVLAGNYFVPGSSMLTSRLTSEGSQKQLNSTLGKLAQVGTGLSGAGVGSDMTGIPASGGYSALSDMFNSAGGGVPGAAPTGGGVDLGTSNAGYDTTGMAPTSSTAAAPVFTPSTVAQGSNIAPAASGYDMGPYSAPINAGANFTTDGGMDVGGGFNPAAGYQASPGFLASLGAGNFGDAASAAGNWAAKNPIPAIYAGGSLYDMYAKNQMAKKQQALYDQNRADILSTYQPGSPEYNLLKQEMDRKDAAAGRNSQYGTRANEFAANIAKFRTNALGNLATGQNALYNTSLGNQYGMMNTPLTLAALTATQKPTP